MPRLFATACASRPSRPNVCHVHTTEQMHPRRCDSSCTIGPNLWPDLARLLADRSNLSFPLYAQSGQTRGLIWPDWDAPYPGIIGVGPITGAARTPAGHTKQSGQTCGPIWPDWRSDHDHSDQKSSPSCHLTQPGAQRTTSDAGVASGAAEVRFLAGAQRDSVEVADQSSIA